jgi:hypothetical protein
MSYVKYLNRVPRMLPSVKTVEYIPPDSTGATHTACVTDVQKVVLHVYVTMLDVGVKSLSPKLFPANVKYDPPVEGPFTVYPSPLKRDTIGLLKVKRLMYVPRMLETVIPTVCDSS